MTAGDGEHVDRLTSLAVGLAFSNGDRDRSIDELVRTAEGDPSVLRAACGRVVGLPVGDAATHQAAVDLLSEAAHRCERDRAEA